MWHCKWPSMPPFWIWCRRGPVLKSRVRRVRDRWWLGSGLYCQLWCWIMSSMSPCGSFPWGCSASAVMLPVRRSWSPSVFACRLLSQCCPQIEVRVSALWWRDVPATRQDGCTVQIQSLLGYGRWVRQTNKRWPSMYQSALPRQSSWSAWPRRSMQVQSIASWAEGSCLCKSWTRSRWRYGSWIIWSCLQRWLIKEEVHLFPIHNHDTWDYHLQCYQEPTQPKQGMSTCLPCAPPPLDSLLPVPWHPLLDYSTAR